MIVGIRTNIGRTAIAACIAGVIGNSRVTIALAGGKDYSRVNPDLGGVFLTP